MGAGVSADDGGYVRVNPTRSQGYEVCLLSALLSLLSLLSALCCLLFAVCALISTVCSPLVSHMMRAVTCVWTLAVLKVML